MPRFLEHYNAKAGADLDHLEVALPSDTGQHSKKGARFGTASQGPPCHQGSAPDVLRISEDF